MICYKVHIWLPKHCSQSPTCISWTHHCYGMSPVSFRIPSSWPCQPPTPIFLLGSTLVLYDLVTRNYFNKLYSLSTSLYVPSSVQRGSISSS